MARIRSIKPEFWESESVGRLSRDARLLFIGLWSSADDHGRFRAHPRLLASGLFPYDDDAKASVPTWLGELQREGCVELYQAGEDRFGHIPKWETHQKIDRPSPSRFPEPPLASPREPSRVTIEPSIIPSAGAGSREQGEEQGAGSVSPPPKEAVEPPRIANPDCPSLKFFVRAEDSRTDARLAREKPPPLAKLAAWYSQALGELGGDEARLWEAWLSFGDDAYWQERKCPFNGFMSQWEKYAPQAKRRRV